MKRHIARLAAWWKRRQAYNRKVRKGAEWARHVVNEGHFTYDHLWIMFQADNPFAQGVRNAVEESDSIFW